jgi:hypothetical protein
MGTVTAEERHGQLWEDQLQRERDMLQEAFVKADISAQKVEEGQKSLSETGAGVTLLSRYVEPVALAIDGQLEKALAGRAGRGVGGIKALSQLDSRQAAYITVRALLDAGVRGDSFASTVREIGRTFSGSEAGSDNGGDF